MFCFVDLNSLPKTSISLHCKCFPIIIIYHPFLALVLNPAVCVCEKKSG